MKKILFLVGLFFAGSLYLPGLHAQTTLYFHSFGSASISGHPYTVAPDTLDVSLSASVWSNSSSSWTSYTGQSGQALAISNTSGDPTITLRLNIAPGYELSIIDFSFWSQRSPTGAPDWNMTINGIQAGSGTVLTGGASTGNLPVANPVSGITDSLLIEISLSHASGSGTFRIDNFKITGSVTPVASGGNSSQSDIIHNTSFAAPQDIPYLNYQESADLNLSNSLEIGQFTIRDGGGTADTDSLPTSLTGISFLIHNHSFLQRLALYDGTTELAESPVSGNTISFSGLNGLSAPDDSFKTFSLRASFTTSVTDKEQFSISVFSADTDPSGSSFAAVSAGGAATSTAGNNNRIQVAASRLDFNPIPPGITVNTPVAPALILKAVDAASNLDLDFSGTVSLTVNGSSFDAGAGTTETAVNGEATFGNLIFSASGTGVTLAASATGLTQAISNPFNVSGITSIINPGDVVINQFSPDYNNPSDEYVELVNTTDKTIDLSMLKLVYQPSGGNSSSSGGSLSGILEPHSFWLLATNPIVSVAGNSINRDGSFNSGFGNSNAQIAIRRVSDNGIIDGLAYGNPATNNLGEGIPALNPSSNSGLKRKLDGKDTGDNSTDFIQIDSVNVYLRNSSSRLANDGAMISSGSYEDIFVTGNAFMGGDISVNHTLSLDTGSFHLGGHTLTVYDTIRGNGMLSGTTASNLIVAGPAGPVFFLPGFNNLDNLTLLPNGWAFLGNALHLHGTLKSDSLSYFNTWGHLTLTSASASHAARVAAVQGTLAGAVTVERYLSVPAGAGSTGRAWRLLTAPLTGNTDNSVYYNWQNNGIHNGSGIEIWGPAGTGMATGPLYSLRKYDAFNNTYQNVINTLSETLFDANGNKAFMIFSSGPYGSGNISSGTAATKLSAKGDLITGTRHYSFTPNGNNNLQLIGNPYASPVDFDGIFNNSGTSHILRKFWVLDPAQNDIGGYVLVQWNPVTNHYDVIPSSAQTQIIQNGQAFFVQAAGSGTATVSIQEQNKSADSSQTPVFRQNAEDLKKISLNLLVASGSAAFYQIDGALVNCHGDFSTAVLNDEDGMKLPNFNENIYIKNGTAKLSIDSRPLFEDGDTLYIGLSGMRQNNYQLEILPETLNVPGLSAMLYDQLLNTITAISSTGLNYPFTVNQNPASGNDSRFFIVFRNNSPLSLRFTNFEIKEQKDGKLNLNWKVADETDVLHYEIEKSSNGSDFEKQSFMKAQNKDDYFWTDEKPLQQAWYRIKAVLVSGKPVFSRALFREKPSAKMVIEAFPNPIGNQEISLRIFGAEEGFYKAVLSDISGKHLAEKTFYLAGTELNASWHLGAMRSGIYRIFIYNKEGHLISQLKLVKP